jgi:hypothetical protein
MGGSSPAIIHEAEERKNEKKNSDQINECLLYF